ncbi:DUF3757 domain-containing protein [Pseudomonas akapageensis]|uniref:DUF3757 domain-containing protein n=1 Tax=Pseudomonas akapageensis TaxID=2609961 RepID=UPI00140D1970|nr:DUF3757 domain-containing protein [Pseudomonas akapageensis]
MLKLKPTLLVLLPALFAGNALAGTVEFCPNPREIQNTNGVLTVKTENGKGEWLGVLQNPNTSVTTFDNAIFYPANGNAEDVGRLRACTFNTTDAQKVDMRYRPDVQPDIPVRLKWPPAWEKKEGPFGLVYFECTSQELQGCAFEEAR